MKTYKVSNGAAYRTVIASSEAEAIEKATGRSIDRFTKVGVREYKETACSIGHQCVYSIELSKAPNQLDAMNHNLSQSCNQQCYRHNLG